MRTFGPGSPSLRGTVNVPGDKSLSHRAVLFSAMAQGATLVSGLLDSADVRSTIAAVRKLGARVDLAGQPDQSLAGSVEGWGPAGPGPDGTVLDCGNSGTTCRLLMGVLAGWPIQVTLTGDESLSTRPMGRVTEPLTQMGAAFRAAEGGTLPITMRGREHLAGLDYHSPVASAQVKSALLLAGLRADGVTRVSEPARSRDHTERLLPAFGASVEVEEEDLSVDVRGPVALRSAGEIDVPRDPSSAAFLTVAALLVPGSDVSLPGVSLNETRTGFLRVLERMGAHIDVVLSPEMGTEPVGTLDVRYTPQLRAATVPATEVPTLIDEIPILALVAAIAGGTSRFEGVGELRVKESDRLSAIVAGLRALGVRSHVDEDTLVVIGAPSLLGASVDSLGDHRLAMTWAIAGLIADGPVSVDGFEAIDVSYPHFAEDLAALSASGA